VFLLISSRFSCAAAQMAILAATQHIHHHLLTPLASSARATISPAVAVNVGGSVTGNVTGSVALLGTGHVTFGPSQGVVKTVLSLTLAGAGIINFFKAGLLWAEGKAHGRQAVAIAVASAASALGGSTMALLGGF
ncbi:MAG TPA: hypothetical protein VLG71_02550, partial [Candidatus Limnocylindria bacterium]|nr:hypothetical protein [Candidatus Limnocylindria bacterium]